MSADRGDNLPEDPEAPAPGAAEVEEAVGKPDPAAKPDKPDAPAKPDAPERGEDGKFIPKDRFDKAVGKERGEKEALAAQVAEYQERDARAAAMNNMADAQKAVKEMITQHSSLLSDGKLEQASDLMEKILDYRQAISERMADTRAEKTKVAAKEEIRYDNTVSTIETQYPVLNPDDEAYDTESVRKVQAYMAGLMQTEKKSPAAALREAVDTILGKPKAAEAAAPKEDAGLRRKEEGVKKALDAKGKQPASTASVGMDHDKSGGGLDAASVMKMNWDEFVKLPDSELSKMRGDFIN